jgi:hypothetical protein
MQMRQTLFGRCRVRDLKTGLSQIVTDHARQAMIVFYEQQRFHADCFHPNEDS